MLTPGDANLLTLTAGDRSWMEGLSVWMDMELARKPCPGCAEVCDQCDHEGLD